MKPDITAVFGVVAAMVTAAAAMIVPKFRAVFCVPEGYAGLVYRHGLYIRRSNAGRHVLWGTGWVTRLVDLRKAWLLAERQEVLTADNVGLKVSVLVVHQVTQPARAVHDTQDWHVDVRNIVQVTLCDVVGGAAVESLLSQRHELGAQLLARAQPEVAKVGVNVLAVKVKEIVLPADRRRTYSEEFKAGL